MATKWEDRGGGASEVLSLKKRGGEVVVMHAEGRGATKSFEVVLTQEF